MATKTYTIDIRANTRSAERGILGLGISAKQATGALAALGGALGAREYLQTVNTFQQLQNQLKVVTNGSQELAQVQGQLLTIAGNTRSSLAATTDLYSKMALATGDLGINQDKMLLITENVNKALAITGTSGPQAESAILQLSQAFASGVLRGEEFNAVNEAAPEIITQLAKGMGVTRGEMRSMAEQGKITADVMANILGVSIDDLNEKFGRTGTTIGQANTVLGDAFTVLTGTIDEATGASDLYTSVLLGLAEIIRDFAGYLNEDLAKGMQDTIDKTRAATSAQAQFNKKLAESKEKLMDQVQLLEAEGDYQRQRVKLTQEMMNREKEFRKVLTGDDLQRALAASNNEWSRQIELLKRGNELKYVEYTANLQLLDSERQRISNVLEYLTVLDELDKAKLEQSDRERFQLMALEQLKKRQHDAELARMQEVISAKEQEREATRTRYEYEQVMAGKTADEAKTYADFQMKTDQEKAQFAIGQAADTFKALGQYNKQAFQAYKAFAIAQAIQNTYLGATKALASYPPPFNFLAAAAVVAGGLAQVASIRSQQYSGREFGGPVTGGTPFIVGERGPELFVPQGNGSVVPNNKMGQSQDVTVNFNIQAVDASSIDEMIVQRRGLITSIIREATEANGRRSMV